MINIRKIKENIIFAFLTLTIPVLTQATVYERITVENQTSYSIRLGRTFRPCAPYIQWISPFSKEVITLPIDDGCAPYGYKFVVQLGYKDHIELKPKQLISEIQANGTQIIWLGYPIFTIIEQDNGKFTVNTKYEK